MQTISISDRTIGIGLEPLLIAEMSGNHNGSLERALAIVDAAAESGAHALKLQTYTADTLTVDADREEFRVEDVGTTWRGRTLHSLYEEASTPWEWHSVIFERCQQKGLIPFSSVFDHSSVEFLESLRVPCYKVGSFECTDIPLLRKVARTGKPIIASVGMATLVEIAELVEVVRAEGNEQLILLKCTSSYPASGKQANLRTMGHLAQTFRLPVGLSDHTLGTGTAVAAVALGASVVEKHLTLARSDGGVDSSFSLEPSEFADLSRDAVQAWQSLGSVVYGPQGGEEHSRKYRKSIYVVSPVRCGDVLSEKNLRSIRPGNGLHPRFLDVAIGKRASRDIAAGTPLSWDHIFS